MADTQGHVVRCLQARSTVARLLVHALEDTDGRANCEEAMTCALTCSADGLRPPCGHGRHVAVEGCARAKAAASIGKVAAEGNADAVAALLHALQNERSP